MSLSETISDQNITQIEKIMLQKLGKDLRQFKRPFLNRRISARMRTVGVQDGSEYAKLLQDDLNEATLLFKSFSINVTEFYRDPFVWQSIASQILPQITKTNKMLKVWSAGCASGEEPYSLAIMLKESPATRNLKFSIIATDISKDAIQKAKEGRYTSQSLKNLQAEMIAKYFSQMNEGTFEVNPQIKELVNFEHEDILSLPAEQINLVTCRNVLIYYDKPAQELIFKKFHKSLKNDGYLIIGQDETMMGVEAAKLFTCMMPRERIYVKLPVLGDQK
ncbi:MAG TPA: protein-glutamate O-methyltransferase CheR [Candidatus Nitrosotenuis sp.]|nr:protein-glutamate O-methyltransferase CheR [Candidatus Nitrosotenuis sp.]